MTRTQGTNKAGRGAAGRRIQVRRSGVHGKGVFAVAPIALVITAFFGATVARWATV